MFAFRTLKLPLSQDTTAGSGTLRRTLPPLPGAVTERPPSKLAEITFEAEDQPRRSATPGPVEPAPVSAADFPQ